MDPTHVTVTAHSPTHTGGLCFLDSRTAIIVYAISLALLAVLATVENIVILVVIATNKVLQTPSTLLLGILAVIDLMTSAIVTPIKIWLTVAELETAFFIDVVVAFICMFLAVVFYSLSTVMVISIDRFLQVYFLESYHLTVRKMIAGLAASWLVPSVITASLAMRRYDAWVGWICVFYFLFAIVVMLIAYIGMIIKLRRHVSDISSKGNSDTAMERTVYVENQRHAVKTSLIIATTCAFMNFAPVLSIVFDALDIVASKSFCAMTYFTLLANSAVNPVIYCLRMRVLRRLVMKLVRGWSFGSDVNDEEEVLSEAIRDTKV